MSISSSNRPAGADLARALLSATRSFERQMLDRLARAGLDMLAGRHLPVLRGLDPDHGARAAELARAAGITRQAIAQVIAELEALGIVEQIPDSADARAKVVRYTPYGLDGYRRAMTVFTELEREAADAIGPHRLVEMKHDLETLSSLGP